uniref:Uncharacterized protein n=1 Tax=Anguilla anguilla TaxID=7936 RepID=A0A0E9TJU6_ANGAN
MVNYPNSFKPYADINLQYTKTELTQHRLVILLAEYLGV